MPILCQFDVKMPLFTKSVLFFNFCNCHQKGKVANKDFFFFHPEPRPWLEEPDVHLALPLRVEPFEEHPDDLRDLPHDEHHHRALLGHQKSTRVQSGPGEESWEIKQSYNQCDFCIYLFDNYFDQSKSMVRLVTGWSGWMDGLVWSGLFCSVKKNLQ